MNHNAFCGNLEFSASINILATAIASQFDTVEEQAAAAAILTQIADTIAAIAAKNALCKQQEAEAQIPERSELQ